MKQPSERRNVLIQHEHYLPREDWANIKRGDRIQVTRTDNTVVQGPVKTVPTVYGVEVGPYYVNFLHIVSIKMIKAYDLEENLERLARAMYYGEVPGWTRINWDYQTEGLKERYYRMARVFLAEMKLIEKESHGVCPGGC